VASNIRIKSATEKDHKYILGLCDRTIGTGMLKKDYLEDHGVAFYVAKLGNRRVGFGAVEIYEPLGFEDHVVGLIGYVCVEPDIQQKGIGTLLVEFGTESLMDAGADVIRVCAWEDHKGCHLGAPLERNGYVAEERHTHRWIDEPDGGQRCLTCGFPCVCTAVYYNLWVNKEAQVRDAITKEIVENPDGSSIPSETYQDKDLDHSGHCRHAG